MTTATIDAAPPSIPAAAPATRRTGHPILNGYGAFTDKEVADIEAMAIELSAAITGAPDRERATQIRAEAVYHPAMKAVRLPTHRKEQLVGRITDAAMLRLGEGARGKGGLTESQAAGLAAAIGRIEERLDAFGDRIEALENAFAAAALEATAEKANAAAEKTDPPADPPAGKAEKKKPGDEKKN